MAENWAESPRSESKPATGDGDRDLVRANHGLRAKGKGLGSGNQSYWNGVPKAS